jgi:uncharacterized repeat protein (TIGR01451 family)
MSSHSSPRRLDARIRKYRDLLAMLLCFTSYNLYSIAAGLAQSAPGGAVIDNQATGSFFDSFDDTVKTTESNIVVVQVAEVAGITVTTANTPTAIVGATTNFDFKITNFGNDPTKFFLPKDPSSITGGTAIPLRVIAYISAAGTRVDLTTPIVVTSLTGSDTGALTDPTLGGNTTIGSIPAGAAIIVRFAVLVTATTGSPVSVTLGNTTNQPSNSNTPYIVGANGTVGTGNDVYTVDNADGSIAGEAGGAPVNGGTSHRQEASAIQTVTVGSSAISVKGTVFSDADANVTIDGSDAGTNTGSVNLTIYAIDTANKVLAKATVDANGNYTLANVPANASVKLRLSNDASYAIDTIAPTVPSLPGGWFHTGKNLNGTIDGTIATLGDIALNTTTTNLTAQNFGIRQSYVLPASPVPTTCSANFTTNLNTGVSASGGQLADGTNDLNWTAEWLNGPPTGAGTPYSLPRPVGIMPAVVTGNLANFPGGWVAEPTNARWISYPFRLPFNSNGNHTDADLDGRTNETPLLAIGTTDTVRLKFTAKLTLPSNASSIAVSLPVGVSVDNQFVSLKVNNQENLVSTPVQNPDATDYRSTQSVNIQTGWQPGVNTIEVILDSGPDRVGFFLAVQATTTQICASNNPNLLLVKRITAINGATTTSGGDNLAIYKHEASNPYDDNVVTSPALTPPDTDKWPVSNSFPFMIGGTNGGNVKPKDSLEYTIYFLSAGDSPANNVLFCDRVPANVTFNPNTFTNTTANPSGVARGIAVSSNGNLNYYTNVGGDDIAQYFPPGIEPSTIYPNISCGKDATSQSLPNNNGAVVVNLGNRPQATGTKATDDAAGAYGFVRFQGLVK